MPDARRGRRLLFSLVLTLLLLLPLATFLGPRFLTQLEVARGRRAGEAGDHLEAMRRLALAAQTSPEGITLWEDAALHALSGGQVETARRYLEEAQAAGVLSPQGHLLLGDLYNGAGDVPAAVRAWETARAALEPEAEVLHRLIEGYRESGDFQAEEAVRRELLTLRPADAQLAYEIALLAAVRRPEEALAYLTQAADQDPALSDSALELSQVIRRSALVSDDPAYVYTEVGRALGAMERWRLAERAFFNATRQNPDYAPAWAFLGEARQRNGLPAQNALDEAYRLDPSSVVVNTLYALFWQRLGRPTQALQHLETALEADPQNPTLLTVLAATTSGLGEVQSALNLFIEAANRAPEDPRYWRVLARYSISNEVQVVDIGLPAARQALLLQPEDPEALDLVGQAYLVIQDTLLAERFFQRALASDPEYEPAVLHLGMLYMSIGQRGLARARLEQVIATAPDSAGAAQARLLLEAYFP